MTAILPPFPQILVDPDTDAGVAAAAIRVLAGLAVAGGTIYIRTKLGSPTYQSGSLLLTDLPPYLLTTPVRREQTQITDSDTGRTGFFMYINGNSRLGAWIVIDLDDRTAGRSSSQWEYRLYTIEMYGGRYIRWANVL